MDEVCSNERWLGVGNCPGCEAQREIARLEAQFLLSSRDIPDDER